MFKSFLRAEPKLIMCTPLQGLFSIIISGIFRIYPDVPCTLRCHLTWLIPWPIVRFGVQLSRLHNPLLVAITKFSALGGSQIGWSALETELKINQIKHFCVELWIYYDLAAETANRTSSKFNFFLRTEHNLTICIPLEGLFWNIHSAIFHIYADVHRYQMLPS